MKLAALLFTFMITSGPVLAQPLADDIIGIWVAGENKAKVQIYKSGNKYHGKITWLRDPMKEGKPKVDSRNPDPDLRSTPVIGLVVLRNFVFDDGEWLSGQVYDPSSGKEYSCRITMPDKNTLKVRGYIGFSLLGRTEIWKRAEFARPNK